MGNISVESGYGVPRLVCTDCSECSSIMGQSLCSVTRRGCCHYFPEFTLADIHRMTVLPGGMDALNVILAYPGTVIYNYNLHAKGYFDKIGYDDYVNSRNMLEVGTLNDHTKFFKTCPFVKPGSGCILQPHFRTTVCNFFICSDIIERPAYKKEFEIYLEERTRYSRWMYRENNELQHILAEHDLNLINDFKGSLVLLRGLSLNQYEFPDLKPVEYS